MRDVEPYFTFAQVVRSGSFTAAARALGVTKATVSKQVGALEQALGVRLLRRTTRSLALTAEGRTLYARCRRMAEELEAARAEVALHRDAPRGPLRVSVPMTFGLLHVVPAVPEFLDRYPEVDLDLQFDDRLVDLVRDGFDVCVRAATLADSTHVARRLASSARVIVATPEYLARHGTPRTPDDLRAHRCLNYTLLASGPAWTLRGPDGEVDVDVKGPLRANSSLALKAAVLAHVGLAQFPAFVVDDELRAARLVRVLEPWAPPPVDVWAVHASGRTVAPKIEAWVGFLQRRFAPGWGVTEPPGRAGAGGVA